MSLSTPILFTPPAFDATEDYNFTFNVLSGDQVVSNTLTITNNETNQQVYSANQTTFRYIHTVPAGTLTNGTYYSATLVTFNSSGESSSTSNEVQFYCYSTPTFTISNLSSGAIVRGSSIELDIYYDQAQSELLNTYSVILYDQSLTPISNSGILYANSTDVPLTVNYTITELENGNIYYVVATGVTVNNTTITTPNYNFTVNYSTPSVQTLLQLTNNCAGGYITVQSNISAIGGTVTPSPPVYIEDSELDITNGNVVWNEGFTIPGDFTCLIKGRDFGNYSTVAIFTDEKGATLTIDYMLGYDDNNTLQSYARLRVTQNQQMYEIFSAYQTPPASDETPVFIWFRRIGNLYEIYLTVES